MIKNYLKILVVAVVFCSCDNNKKSNADIVQVDQTTIGKQIERLASDEFLGRKPFTEGEVKTVNYLKEEFEKLGLLPGNDNSFFQDVPMVEITGTPSENMVISGKNGNINLEYLKDFVATTNKPETEVGLENSELVFAGYGVVAPEYGWNDYEGIDWKGKTAVVLINDPGFESGDSTLFKGNEMTYYGRWTYKYEEAARQGADGLIIIHDTEPAAYGWNVIESGWSGARLTIESDLPLLNVESWISGESAEKMFNASSMKGQDYKTLARNKDFKPIPLDLNVTVDIKNEIKKDDSKNVVALIPGTERKDEYIIYSAHWDHFGVGKAIDGDSIYNGAVDNASGTAGLLAIAEAFKKNGPTKRSIVFIAVTGEEQGLLGSAYYAENPIYDPKKTVADINIDALDSPGKMKDLTITGYGHSEMDEYAKEAAEKQDRYVIPDPEAEKGYFFRSDHFNFAKIGIPALYASGAYEGFDISIDGIKKYNDNYRLHKYHQPSDEYDAETTELSGVQLDLQLLFEVGLKLATEDYFPKWYDGSEFKSARE
ncbi:MAG: M28 family metallopeptidase [Bacteroidota bacterium]|uniref:M20/M25/M40 family metallo-hydrolase n=1 Tax=Flagellimonas profundi TaxID=2915620 RepID=A0ABS3FJM9_9FLAO|nr:M28 family metallopeptidase [Allomuricauda profundi]MBO0343087.1 M20/M25/M40 family metallo-hydrolase [Allomuricauda profundi]MEC7769760.1 M28 family metallopeptidase [Bacteroidota bacterium]